MTLLLVLMALISSSVFATNQDLIVATQEMKNANYFTFVLLLNMAPNLTFQENITFLMPNDRALSEFNMAQTSVPDFLLRHSIPSPLLIDHLEHFPTGSMIPTSKPEFMFKVTNDGRRRFFLSNVRITSPNICTKGSSIRCHGIDGVMQPTMAPCSSPPVVVTPPPPPPDGGAAQPPAAIMPPSPPPPIGGAAQPPAAIMPPSLPQPDGGAAQPPAVMAAPSPSVVEVGPPTSSSHRIGHAGLVDLVVTFSMVAVLVKFLYS